MSSLDDGNACNLYDSRGTLPAHHLSYDPATHDVLPTGAPDISTAVDAHVGCR